MSNAMLYLGAAVVSLWGIAHLVPTRDVVPGFGDMGEDNRHIITMEGIVEGVALLFMGALVIAVPAIDPSENVSLAVYIVVGWACLPSPSSRCVQVSRYGFLPFRLCPLVLTLSAALVLVGAAKASIRQYSMNLSRCAYYRLK